MYYRKFLHILFRVFWDFKSLVILRKMILHVNLLNGIRTSWYSPCITSAHCKMRLIIIGLLKNKCKHIWDLPNVKMYYDDRRKMKSDLVIIVWLYFVIHVPHMMYMYNTHIVLYGANVNLHNIITPSPVQNIQL